MSVLGIGTDIVEISRIGADKLKDKLAKRILTPAELAEYQAHTMPERFLAKRFAAKEAAVKALGTGIGHGISWQHFSIANDSLGKPELTLTGEAKTRADAMGVSAVHLSIADERHYAVATVVFSK